jgi:hypothetical protein
MPQPKEEVCSMSELYPFPMPETIENLISKDRSPVWQNYCWGYPNSIHRDKKTPLFLSVLDFWQYRADFLADVLDRLPEELDLVVGEDCEKGQKIISIAQLFKILLNDLQDIIFFTESSYAYDPVVQEKVKKILAEMELETSDKEETD